MPGAARTKTGHVHELELDGLLVTTGPPVELGEPELEGGSGSPPSTRRRRPAKRKKAGEDVVDHDGFIPGCIKHADEIAEEGRTAAHAYQSGDAKLLIGEAAKTHARMLKSAHRWCSDDAYSEFMAWRAIRQEYGIDPAKSLTSPRLKRLAGEARLRNRRKNFHVGTIGEERAGNWRIPLALEGAKDADLYYESVDEIPLVTAPEATVVVGINGDQRNLLEVLVPTRMVSGRHGGHAAIKWVHRHWDEISRLGRGEVAFRLVKGKGIAGERDLIGSHQGQFKLFAGHAPGTAPRLVADPEEALQQIAYHENYRPCEVDDQGEWATSATVQKMAYGFQLGRGTPGEMHARWMMPDGTQPGYTVETFLTRRGDPDFEVPGSWAAATLFHDDVWAKVRKRVYPGPSIGGAWASVPIEMGAA